MNRPRLHPLASLAALLLAAALPACTTTPATSLRHDSSHPVRMKSIALRLHPGQDLKGELDALARRENWGAACVLSCAGSLTSATLRYANQHEATTLRGHFEIVSLSGTLAATGSHLHLSISDGTGRTIGGHLKEGSVIYTTAEIVIGILPGVEFRREPDPATGYPELTIHDSAQP